MIAWTLVSLGLFAAFVLILGALVFYSARKKNVELWLGPYIAQRRRSFRSGKRSLQTGNTHILFCMVDHFEPISAGSTKEQERQRIDDWLERYPVLARRHSDSDGRPPQHTWFYPGENYDAEYLDALTRLCRQGLGEIELHLHHGNDTNASLRVKIQKAISDFAKHGALTTQETQARHVYGFIHGNMALDNSMNNPALCGVNDEITVLKETGCYADYSMPTAPAVSQPKKVNTIYYATDDPQRPKSHDDGVDVEVGREPSGDLMIIPGPLGFSWHRRKWGIIPRIENSEVQESCPPTSDRIHKWVQLNICVKGRPEWVVVKISCHGAEDRSRELLLGAAADQMYTDLERRYRDSRGYCLHYVTARELYNIIKAAEAGLSGNPGLYRDYAIPRYQTHRNETMVKIGSMVESAVY